MRKRDTRDVHEKRERERDERVRVREMCVRDTIDVKYERDETVRAREMKERDKTDVIERDA